MTELTDSFLDGVDTACIVKRRAVPTLEMRVDDMELIVRTIREQRAEIERLRGALPAEEEWKRRAAQALSGHDMRVADEEKTDDQ